MTLIFVGLGAWAFLAAQNSGGLVLAVFGLFYGMATFGGPAVGVLQGPVGFLQSHASLFITTLLFHFLLIYPTRKGSSGEVGPYG